jgi:hypothetical protein
MLMALPMFTKWWKITTMKKSITSLIFILNFQKKGIRFIMISKIKLKIFQINFMFKSFYVFNVRIIRII